MFHICWITLECVCVLIIAYGIFFNGTFNFIFFYSSSKFYVNWEAYGCGWREAPQQCVTGVLWCSRLFIKCCSSRLNTYGLECEISVTAVSEGPFVGLQSWTRILRVLCILHARTCAHTHAHTRTHWLSMLTPVGRLFIQVYTDVTYCIIATFTLLSLPRGVKRNMSLGACRSSL